MKLQLQLQVYIAVAVAIVVGALFFFANHTTRVLLHTHADVLDRIGGLERQEQDLHIQILEATSHIEYAYDSVQLLSRQLRQSAKEILSPKLISGEVSAYSGTIKLLQEYDELARNREELIQKFNTVNSVIKNSTSQIPTLGSRYLSRFGSADTDYLYEISRLTAATFQAANNMDIGYSDIIKESMARLEHFELKDPDKQEFNRTLLSHAKVFLHYVPLYRPLIRRIEDVPTRQKLTETRARFLLESKQEFGKVSALTLFLASAFIATIMLVIYFLVILNRENAKLQVLHRQLQQAARHDTLTGLLSRFAYEQDHREIDNAALIVINLDSFTHYNDFYGTKAGDYILKRIAVTLSDELGTDDRYRLYRVGGDDFGILMKSANGPDVQTCANNLVKLIERISFNIDDCRVMIGARAGCALEEPLLEKADMALKETKRGRQRILVYNDDLGLHQRVAENLRVINMLKRAIARGAIVPYFQPILDLGEKRITRYECLMRVINESGAVVLPEEFLQVAKDSNLYADLSRIMIEKSIERFKDEPYGFSINLSIEDILDEGVIDFLFQRLEENPDVAKRMTLEILESEEVENYDKIKQFVRRAQSCGCQVAIDDFGSGYSSLKHLLELKVDILKIDETLVRELDQDATLRLLVGAILKLAHGVGIGTVTAEFVHNREVLEIVAEQGIHYAQGFHIGKPEPNLAAVDRWSSGLN